MSCCVLTICPFYLSKTQESNCNCIHIFFLSRCAIIILHVYVQSLSYMFICAKTMINVYMWILGNAKGQNTTLLCLPFSEPASLRLTIKCICFRSANILSVHVSVHIITFRRPFFCKRISRLSITNRIIWAASWEKQTFAYAKSKAQISWSGPLFPLYG